MDLNSDAATEKVDSGEEGTGKDEQKVGKKSVGSSSTAKTDKGLASKPSVKKSRGSTSRRGGRGKRGRQMKYGPPTSFQEALFNPTSPVSDTLSPSHITPTNQEMRNDEGNTPPRVTPPKYISFDVLKELRKNIDTGMENFETAFELIRYGIIQLKEAKISLQSINHGQRAEVGQDSQGDLFSNNLPSTSYRNPQPGAMVETQTSGYSTSQLTSDTMATVQIPGPSRLFYSRNFPLSIPSPVQVQFEVDNHQFLYDQTSATANAESENVANQLFSAYDPELAHQGLDEFKASYSSSLGKVQNDLNNQHFPAVVLDDVQSVLDHEHILSANAYSAEKVEASVGKKMNVVKMKREIQTPTASPQIETRKRKPGVLNDTTHSDQSNKQIKVKRTSEPEIKERAKSVRLHKDSGPSSFSSMPRTQPPNSSKAQPTNIESSSGTEVQGSLSSPPRDEMLEPTLDKPKCSCANNTSPPSTPCKICMDITPNEAD